MNLDAEATRPKRSLFSSLRARLILLVVIAVMPVLGLTFYTAVEQRQLATVGVQETALRLARLTSTQQGQMILGARQLLTGLAQLREVRQDNSAICSSFFAVLLKAYPVYSNMGAIDRDGHVYCSAVPMVGSTNAADRPYFQRAIQSADFAIGDYQIGRITGKAAINFAYPIFDDKRTIEGVVFAALSLDWLNQVVKQADLPKDSTFSVTDRHGTILVRYPDAEKWIGKKSPERVLVTSARSFLSGVAEASEPDGISRLIGFTPLLGNKDAGDVYVSIGIPKRVAFAEADWLLARNLTWLAIIAVIAFGAAWVGGDFFILRQVTTLVESVKELETGNLNTRIGPPYWNGELGKLARTFDEMAVSLQKHAVQLEYQATHDALTGLANRDFFIDHVQSEIFTAQATGQHLALLIMDLDRFKEINDTIGHHNGDLLLQQATQRLRSVVGKAGIVARPGGDEFSVFLLTTNIAGAILCAQKIVRLIA
jgi:HAMP domain-containing protein